MNVDEKLDALAVVARDEAPPLVDAVDPVLRRLQLGSRIRERPIRWFAVAAAVAACVVALLAVRTVVVQQGQLLPPIDPVIAQVQ